MKGLTVGIVFTDDGETCVGLTVGDLPTLALPVQYALDFCEQLSVVLEQITGVSLEEHLDEDEDEGDDDNEEKRWLQ